MDFCKTFIVHNGRVGRLTFKIINMCCHFFGKFKLIILLLVKHLFLWIKFCLFGRFLCIPVRGTLLLNLAVIRVSQVYFLRDPEIDYSLGGVAGALDIPGLNKEHSPRCTYSSNIHFIVE